MTPLSFSSVNVGVGLLLATASGLFAAKVPGEPARINHPVNAATYEGDRAREREHFETVSLPFPKDMVFRVDGHRGIT